MSVNDVNVNNIDDFKADVSNLEFTLDSTDVVNANIVSVNDVNVNNIDDFKADVSNIELTLDSTDIINSNIVQVNGTDVNSIDEFKADLTDIPNQVWNALLVTHTTVGSFGEALKRTLGLSFENYEISNYVYNNGVLEECTISIYRDNGLVNLLSSYTMTATYTGGVLTGFQVIEV